MDARIEVGDGVEGSLEMRPMDGTLLLVRWYAGTDEVASDPAYPAPEAASTMIGRELRGHVVLACGSTAAGRAGPS